MARIESSVRVSKSSQDVFAFLNKAENHVRFIPNMVEFNKTSHGPFGQVGTTIQGMLRVLGRKIRVQYEIIEHEYDRKLAMQGTMGPVMFRDGYILTPEDNGTEIKFWLELSMTGLARAIGPVGGLIGKIHASETLFNLKRALETTSK